MMFQFLEEIKQQIKEGGIAIVNVASVSGGWGWLSFRAPEGCQCSHWGDLTEVLLGSMMPEQADKNHNPCLTKIMEEKKLQYGFKHTHTHEHTKQKTSPLCSP